MVPLGGAFGYPLACHPLHRFARGERSVLAEYVLVDHAVFDVDYWYDEPRGQSFHAVRVGLSKTLWLGGVGCLTSPIVEGDCRAGR